MGIWPAVVEHYTADGVVVNVVALMVEQSTGLSLDEYFDFIIDNSGDVESVSGVEELKKDLATMAWSIVDGELIGNVLTANLTVSLESRIRTQVSNDARIVAVNEASVSRSPTGTGASVTISADSIYGQVRYSSE